MAHDSDDSSEGCGYDDYDGEDSDGCEDFVKAHNAMVRAMFGIGGGCFSDSEDEEGGEDHPEYPGYTRADLREKVTFLRPGWDEETGGFDYETKDVYWCLSEGFQEVEPGIWSGPWYFEKFPDEEPYVRPRRKEKKKDSDGCEDFVKAHNAMVRAMFGIGGGCFSDSEDEEGGEEHPEYPGYTRADLREKVTFLRPEWDDETGSFNSEMKDVYWCLDNGFQEVEPGIWSGPWYFEKFPDEEPHVRPQRKKTKEETESCNVSSSLFAASMDCKHKGNNALYVGEYDAAIEFYDEAAELLGGDMIGVLLTGQQREEMVKILSNRAECRTCLEQYDAAAMDASYAVQMDKTHAKSLLRFATALFRGAGCDDFGIDPFACGKAIELTKEVICIGGAGVDEARKLKKEIEGQECRRI